MVRPKASICICELTREDIRSSRSLTRENAVILSHAFYRLMPTAEVEKRKQQVEPPTPNVRAPISTSQARVSEKFF